MMKFLLFCVWVFLFCVVYRELFPVRTTAAKRQLDMQLKVEELQEKFLIICMDKD